MAIMATIYNKGRRSPSQERHREENTCLSLSRRNYARSTKLEARQRGTEPLPTGKTCLEVARNCLHALPERVDDELLRVLRVPQKQLERMLLLQTTNKRGALQL